MDKSTDPWSSHILFMGVRQQRGAPLETRGTIATPGPFVWNRKTNKATLAGKPCREISLEELDAENDAREARRRKRGIE